MKSSNGESRVIAAEIGNDMSRFATAAHQPGLAPPSRSVFPKNKQRTNYCPHILKRRFIYCPLELYLVWFVAPKLVHGPRFVSELWLLNHWNDFALIERSRQFLVERLVAQSNRTGLFHR